MIRGYINSDKKLCFKIGKRNHNPQIIDNGKMEVEVESGRILRGVHIFSLIPRTMLHKHIPLPPYAGKTNSMVKFVDHVCSIVQGGYVSHIIEHIFSCHNEGK